MPRSEDEVKRDVIATLNTIDPSIDTGKGPVYDGFIQPYAPEGSKIETDVEHLTALYSRVMAGTATNAEVEAFAANFGIVRSAGKRAKGFVYFYRFTRPGLNDSIEIPQGTVITNTDASLSYRTTERAFISGQYADSYYNSARNRYEIMVPLEASASGEAYSLPAYRVIRLSQIVFGIDGVENRSEVTGGTNSESNADLITRASAKFEGTDKGQPSGVESMVRNYDPSNCKDVSIVTQKDRALFTRIIHDPAMDIYVIGQDIATAEDINTAAGGETLLNLEKVPAIQVDSVQVNGQDVTFTFLPDTTTQTRKSAEAQDQVLLAAPLISGDIVDVNYQYNQLVRGLQDDLFSDEQRFFNTNMLAREAIGAYVTCQANAKVASSYDLVTKQTELENALVALIESNLFVEEYVPSDVANQVRTSVSGVLEFTFTKFTRTVDGTLDVETVTFKANEMPKIDADTFDIKVRQ